jgi:hypothetical protein
MHSHRTPAIARIDFERRNPWKSDRSFVLWSGWHRPRCPTVDTPFKLATFEAGGKTRLGMLVAGTERLLDIAEASSRLEREQRLAAFAIPADMRGLIEEYSRVSPRLYQIANFYKSARLEDGFSFPADRVSIKAPIKYPWNLPPPRPTTRPTPRRWPGRSPGPPRPPEGLLPPAGAGFRRST